MSPQTTSETDFCKICKDKADSKDDYDKKYGSHQSCIKQVIDWNYGDVPPTNQHNVELYRKYGGHDLSEKEISVLMDLEKAIGLPLKLYTNANLMDVNSDSSDMPILVEEEDLFVELGVCVNDGHITIIQIQKQSQFINLPPSISHLEHLVSISIGSTGLTNIPDSIGELINLEFLSLGNNQLGIIPESIGKLPRLRLLDIAENKIQTLPKSIKHLILENKLKEIELFDNNFDDETFNYIKELMEHIDINIYVEQD